MFWHRRVKCVRYIFSQIWCVRLSCDPKIRVCQGTCYACIADRFYLQLNSVYVCVQKHFDFHSSQSKGKMTFTPSPFDTHTKDFTVSVEHVSCLFTSGLDSDILVLIRIHCGVFFCGIFRAAMLNVSKYMFRRDFQAYFTHLKVFPEFSKSRVCSFPQWISAWAGGITGWQKSAWRREEWDKSCHQTDLI